VLLQTVLISINLKNFTEVNKWYSNNCQNC
jgi:hypothetical protein